MATLQSPVPITLGGSSVPTATNLGSGPNYAFVQSFGFSLRSGLTSFALRNARTQTNPSSFNDQIKKRTFSFWLDIVWPEPCVTCPHVIEWPRVWTIAILPALRVAASYSCIVCT